MIRIKTILTLLLVITIGMPGFGMTENEALMRQLSVEMINHNVPGVMVTVVKEGDVYYKGALGEADTLTKMPMDTESSIFQTGSISKVLTAYALLKLMNEAGIDTDAIIGPYLPDYLKEDTYLSSLTFRNLMTHTTGIATIKANSATDEDPLDALSQRFDENAKHFFETYKLKPAIDKDSYTIFSNVGYILSGILIESLSGDHYEYHMANKILLPLGMKPSSDILMKKNLPGYSLIHNYAVFGGQSTRLPSFKSKYLPSDDFVTTLDDMTQLLIAFTSMDSESKIYEAMFTRQFANNPLASGRSFGFTVVNYGNYEVYLHDGGIPGANSRLIVIPEIETAFFLTYNSNDLSARESFTDVIMTDLLGDYRQSTIYEPYTIENLDKFTGVFSPVNTSTETIEQLTKIIHQVRVRETDKGISIDGVYYVPISDTVFYSEAISSYAEYRTNENGRLEYLIIGNSIYEETPIFQSILIQATFLLLLGLFNVISLFLLLTKWSDMKVNRIHDTPRVILLLHSLSVTGVLGFILIISSSYDIWDVIFGINQALIGTKIFGMAMILLTVPSILMLNRASQDYRWSKFMIFVFRFQVFSGIGLSVWLYIYNLIL